MSRIKTAVIPAGGWGKRFLPATKSVPKEMFPLGDKPIILHVVDELVRSGIENIIFIVSPHKQAIERFFAANVLFEEYLLHNGSAHRVKPLQDITDMANFSFVYTKWPYGNGGALLPAQHLLKNEEAFVVVWADEIMLTPKDQKPRVLECIEAFEQVNMPIISAVKIVDKKERSYYGMAKLKKLPGYGNDLMEIISIVEKPALGKEPSVYAAHGAYILTNDIFDVFTETPIGKDGELWLVDLINRMIAKKKLKLCAKILPQAMYLDCGTPELYVRSQIHYALYNENTSKDLKDFLKRCLK